MRIRLKDVAIASPCPVELDPDRHRDAKRSFHCGHCDKAVHILSNMTEADARALLDEKAGKDICVSYAIKPDGEVRFAEPTATRPTLVPLAALTSRRRTAAAVAAVGLSAALAACTPHDNPEVHADEIGVQGSTPQMSPQPSIPDAPPQAEKDAIVVGGVEADPPAPQADRMVEGGMVPIAAGEVDEPCDTPKPVEPEIQDRPPRRGRMAVPRNRTRSRSKLEPGDPLKGL